MRSQDSGFSQRDSEGLVIEFIGTLPSKKKQIRVKSDIFAPKLVLFIKTFQFYGLKTLNLKN